MLLQRCVTHLTFQPGEHRKDFFKGGDIWAALKTKRHFPGKMLGLTGPSKQLWTSENRGVVVREPLALCMSSLKTCR